MPDFILRPFIPKPRTVRVRCLGHGPEHYFLSSSPRKNRLCGLCSERVKRLPPRIGDSPAKDERVR